MYRTKMAKRCSKRRRTRRGGLGFGGGTTPIEGRGGGRKKMMRTRIRTRRGGDNYLQNRSKRGGWPLIESMKSPE